MVEKRPIFGERNFKISLRNHANTKKTKEFGFFSKNNLTNFQ